MSSLTPSELQKIDLAQLWHPFTQAKVWLADADPLIIERGEGAELIDVAGRRYLDGVSSLWCNVHGHSHPDLLRALQDQASKICHSTLLGISHRPILELTERLMKVVPADLSRVFYADSGSTAVEAALRIALEWWQKSGGTIGRRKTKLLSLEGAYHGDTLGAVGVGYSETFHASIRQSVIPSLMIQPPHVHRFSSGLSETDATQASLDELERTLRTFSGELAAMIIEPMVQGAAGIWLHSAEFLRSARNLCRQHDVLFIADEVATGFGKSGQMFCCSYAGISPDILVVGKGLSAGYLPISAAITTERLFEGFVGAPEEFKTFYFGQTFAGNPLAARVACENLRLFEETPVLEGLEVRLKHFANELETKIQPLDHVDEIRRFGIMVGIELTQKPKERSAYPVAALAGARIVREARKRGAIIRPLGNVLVLMPPLSMTEIDISRLVDITAASIDAALNVG